MFVLDKGQLVPNNKERTFLLAKEAPVSNLRPHTPYKRVLVLSVLFTVAISLLVLAFSWTSVTSSAKDIPVAITGPAAQVEARPQVTLT